LRPLEERRGRGEMTESRQCYNMLLAYAIKINWAVGERVMRALLLNRNAPAVAGVERNISYVPGGHRLQRLDVIRPLGEAPFPVLVYIHGGAHHFGDKGTYDRICKCFAASGFVVFNANYRMAPRWDFPEQVRDAAAAVKWAYDNAAAYGGDNRAVFIAGDSAGAYFSAMYAVMAHDEEVRRGVPVDECIPAEAIKGLLLFYGVYDLETVAYTKFPFTKLFSAGFLGRDPGLREERAEVGSPIRHLPPGFPPCFIATSELDPLHSETVSFLNALKERGLTYEYLNFPRKKYPFTYHGFLNFWFLASARRAMRGALEFLEKRR
jgi:acetyl esterase/lipase